MLLSKPRSWFDLAIDQPMRVYAAPAEVLRDERLDEAGMRAVLEAWVKAERRILEASGESRTGGSPQLRGALAALAELDRLVLAECG